MTTTIAAATTTTTTKVISEDHITLPGLQPSPYYDAAHELIDAAAQLGQSRTASILRAFCLSHLFRQRERIFDEPGNPVPAFRRLLEETTAMVRSMEACRFAELGGEAPWQAETAENVALKTGEHYGNLFKNFSGESYFEETARLLKARLERNGIGLETIQGKSVLDDGCGGGRYTAAWRKLGAKPAVGVDISEINIGDARRRAEAAGLDGIEFELSDVLNLRFAADTFDIVFSNGVLHHTTDWRRGINELVRVMKPGGLGWLYLIENPGGIFWESIEILRAIMRREPRDAARQALALAGLPGNRIFYMVDHVMAPINIRLTAAEIEEQLKKAGASSIRRLARGADFDRVERIHQNDPFAFEKYGHGENRHVFSKK